MPRRDVQLALIEAQPAAFECAEVELARRLFSAAETMDGRQLESERVSSQADKPTFRARMRTVTTHLTAPIPKRRGEHVDRTAQLIERVFDATALEVGRVGFTGLRIEDIAARSGDGANFLALHDNRWSRIRVCGAV